jgi:hypothetical protein
VLRFQSILKDADSEIGSCAFIFFPYLPFLPFLSFLTFSVLLR